MAIGPFSMRVKAIVRYALDARVDLAFSVAPPLPSPAWSPLPAWSLPPLPVCDGCGEPSWVESWSYDTPSGVRRGHKDCIYDPDYDSALDRIDWTATPADVSPAAHAPEVASSPYAPGDASAPARLWRATAISREADRRHDAGRFGAFTDDELVEARGLARAELRRDPVEEILGHPGDQAAPPEPTVKSLYDFLGAQGFNLDVIVARLDDFIVGCPCPSCTVQSWRTSPSGP